MYHVTMQIMLLFLTNNTHTVFSITVLISFLSSEISQGIYDLFFFKQHSFKCQWLLTSESSCSPFM